VAQSVSARYLYEKKFTIAEHGTGLLQKFRMNFTEERLVVPESPMTFSFPITNPPWKDTGV
jgi:hypothetical protein